MKQATLAAMAALCATASVQTPPATILTIEMENVVRYNENFASPQKNGTSTNMEVQTATPATLFPGAFVGDIVAINGRKSKGAAVARLFTVALNPSPSGSHGISDVNRMQTMDILLEIQQADGTSVGTIVLSGSAARRAPFGRAKIGSGRQLGRERPGKRRCLRPRRKGATIMNTHRSTSTLENAINRRTFPSGRWKIVVQLLPMTSPEVAVTAAGPAIVHASDFSPVTAAKPARAGEYWPSSLPVLVPGVRVWNQARRSRPAPLRL